MKKFDDYEVRQKRIDHLKLYRRSGRMLGRGERRGKVCACCGMPYGKYEVSLYVETEIDPEYHALEMGKLYLCGICYALVSC